MNGAILQLVSYGIEDNNLTFKPQITFFKIVYKRHSNFSIENIEQTLLGKKNFGGTCFCKINKSGDLLNSVYIKVTLPKINIKKAFNNDLNNYYGEPYENESRWVNRIGFRLLKSIELKIGGYSIDKIYSTWMHIWSELTYSNLKKKILDRMIGTKGNNGKKGGSLTNNTIDLQIPLLFSFCRHSGLSIPLLCLKYTDVEIHIEFETLENCYFVNNNKQVMTDNLSGNLTNVALICDYIFLDPDEKNNFISNSHDYLIETLQYPVEDYSVIGNKQNEVPVILNHPVKEIYWIVRKNYSSNIGDKFTDFTSNAIGITVATEGTIVDSSQDNDDIVYNSGREGSMNNVNTSQLKINGINRFEKRNGIYFNCIQPYQFHTGNPDIGINSYSFALNPEDYQPSGACNFSRMENIKLDILPLSSGKLTVMALSYNILRISSGLGKLVYYN